MAKKPKEPEKENHERWLVTYSDLMNLLLILFIILYAMSQVDKAKAEKVAESIRAGFGYVENGGTGAASGEGSGLFSADFTSTGSLPSGGPSDSEYWSQQQEQAFEHFYKEVQQLINENHLDTMVEVKLDDRGVVISFKDNVLFRSGEADLGPASMDLIAKIGTMLKSLNYYSILVEGHTDTDPIHTAKYQDNMDLSTQRAANVWRELVSVGLPPEKMMSIGYGEFRPIAPNDSPENKSKNRRVVITITRNPTNASNDLLSTNANANTPAASSSPKESVTPSASAHASPSASAAHESPKASASASPKTH